MTGNNEKKPVDKKLEREIFSRFSNIVRDKFGSFNDESKVKQLDALYRQSEFSAEKKILSEMNNIGLSKGVLSTIACFAFLRWSPGAISRYMMRRRGSTSGFGSEASIQNPFSNSPGYKLDPPPGCQSSVEKPNVFLRGVRLGLDLFVSLSLGAYTSLFFLDRDKMMKQFSEIPLVQGRSIISEELCHDFSLEFQRYDRSTWDKNHPFLSNGSGIVADNFSFDFTALIQGFVANCKRRATYEKEIREEQGLRDDEPVSIPSPGVPKDINVSLDDLLQGGDNHANDGNNQNEDFYLNAYFEDETENESP